MVIDGEILLDVNLDKKEDTICTIELLQPTSNARLGQEKFARVQILGKGRVAKNMYILYMVKFGFFFSILLHF